MLRFIFGTLAVLAVALPAAAQVHPFPASFTMQDIQRDGVTLHVRVGGKGPAVVLVHGFGDTGDMWEPLAADLARDHTVVVPDLRGLGLSSQPTGGYDKRTQAADIRFVLTTLGLDRAAIIGHDIGTMVAYAYAARYPDKTVKLVVMDAPVPGIPPWDTIVRLPALWHFDFGRADRNGQEPESHGADGANAARAAAARPGHGRQVHAPGEYQLRRVRRLRRVRFVRRRELRLVQRLPVIAAGRSPMGSEGAWFMGCRWWGALWLAVACGVVLPGCAQWGSWFGKGNSPAPAPSNVIPPANQGQFGVKPGPLSSLGWPSKPSSPPSSAAKPKTPEEQKASEMALGRLYERRGEKEQAEAIYKKLAEKYPQDPLPEHRMGVIAVEQGRFAQAQQHFQAAQQHFLDLPGRLAVTFVELVARVRDTALGAYANQDFPFDKLVETMHSARCQTDFHSTEKQLPLTRGNVYMPRFHRHKTRVLVHYLK